jgi:hypothetical protein
VADAVIEAGEIQYATPYTKAESISKTSILQPGSAQYGNTQAGSLRASYSQFAARHW